jgi:addiction module HigA family antidote
MKILKRWPPHPGRILRENFVEPLSLSTESLAQSLDISANRLQRILNEFGDVCPELAHRLAKELNITSEFWLSLQSNYDAWKSREVDITPEAHRRRHRELHEAVDELFADYIINHPDYLGFTSMPIMQLLEWSAKQMENPDHEEKSR